MRVASVAVFVLALGSWGCSQSPETDVTGSAATCAARLYSSYHPKDLKQCMDVCIQCNRGVTTTCSTSCKLKGAS